MHAKNGDMRGNHSKNVQNYDFVESIKNRNLKFYFSMYIFLCIFLHNVYYFKDVNVNNSFWRKLKFKKAMKKINCDFYDTYFLNVNALRTISKKFES